MRNPCIAVGELTIEPEEIARRALRQGLLASDGKSGEAAAERSDWADACRPNIGQSASRPSDLANPARCECLGFVCENVGRVFDRVLIEPTAEFNVPLASRDRVADHPLRSRSRLGFSPSPRLPDDERRGGHRFDRCEEQVFWQSRRPAQSDQRRNEGEEAVDQGHDGAGDDIRQRRFALSGRNRQATIMAIRYFPSMRPNPLEPIARGAVCPLVAPQEGPTRP